jgi:hypothetical protein
MEQITKGGSEDHHELNLGLSNLLLQPHHCFLLKKDIKVQHI